MFRSTAFDKLLDKATSNLLMEPDWQGILEIVDLIRQNDVPPKQALTGIRKKLFNPNPHTAFYALLVLESVVKNCGAAVHEELNSKSYCDMLHELAKTTQHDNVRQKLLELIQTWTFAFRKNPKYGYLKDIMTQMKQEGTKFPALRESDAMFSTDTAPEWADGEVCHRCRVAFTLVQRKHHCRACGQVFCSQCTQKTTSLPKFGIEKEVRVCDACYDQVMKPSSSSKISADKEELPAEYLNSSLAQQNQSPPQKSEEELREEEELQLALALSQSEAEAKEKQKSAVVKEEPMNPELARYMNRTLWENREASSAGVESVTDQNRATSPTAPATAPITEIKYRENGVADNEIDEFVKALKSQVEIFVNRMKSNSSRGRSIANDSSVQTLFMNITQMHSKLLHYIQQHDDSRLHYERLQDKLTQVKDARAALDALREEHREKLRRQAEEAERQRQLQMAHKLDIMRKKKQEYLQYQRQLALQRIQEQEREMQMRQEQQKQQYLMGGGQYGSYIGSPVHGQHYPQNTGPPPMGAYGYQYPQGMPMGPHAMGPPGMAPQSMSAAQMGPSGLQQGPGMPQTQSRMQHPPGFPPGMPPQGFPQTPSQHRPPGMMPGVPSHVQGMPPQQQMMGPQGMPPPPHGVGSQTMMGQQQPPPPQPGQPQFQQPGAPPASPQVNQQNGEAQTAELISFD